MQKIKSLLILTSLFLISSAATAQSISWKSMGEAQKSASESKKKIMIYAEAKWCGYCKKMEQKVFPQQAVQDSIHKYFLPVRVDIESGREIDFNGKTLTQQQLAREFRVRSTPTFIFLDSSGNVMGTQPGYLPPDVFSALVSYVGMELFKNKVPFKSYLKHHEIEAK